MTKTYAKNKFVLDNKTKCEDEDYVNRQFSQFFLELTNELNNLNSESNIYKIDDSGFEYKNIIFGCGEDLVYKLTPNTDWIMTVKVYENYICITVEHHENIHYEEYTVYKPE